MKILVIDTETTSLDPYSGKIVEIAANLLDSEKLTYKTVFDSLCNPHLSKELLESSWICTYGYIKSDDILNAESMENVAVKLQEVIHETMAVEWTSFNVGFDASFLTQKPWHLPWPEISCIMLAATPVCGIPKPWAKFPDDPDPYKWPNLTEAYHLIVNGKPSSNWPSHRALTDCCMATEVFSALIKGNHYSLPKNKDSQPNRFHFGGT